MREVRACVNLVFPYTPMNSLVCPGLASLSGVLGRGVELAGAAADVLLELLPRSYFPLFEALPPPLLFLFVFISWPDGWLRPVGTGILAT